MLFDDSACFRFDRIPVRPIHWLWRPYLTCGKLALLDGDPGTGKSLFTADLGARLTRGGRMVFCLGGVQVGNADGAEMSFPACFEALRRAVVAHSSKLVVIDPMMAFFKPEVAANSDQVMRVALALLAGLAARSGASVRLVRQPTERGGRKALYRSGGSIGVIGAVRTVLFLGRHPSESDRRVLAMTKSNIGPTAPALACQLAEEAGRPRLYGLGACNATADELRRPTLHSEGPHQPTADEWLLAALAGGPRPAAERHNEAKAAGYSERTLLRARKRLGVVARRVMQGGQSFWQWSESAAPDGAEQRQ